MKFIDLVQGTAAWLAWRRCGIGGSDAATIVGVSPFEDATPRKLWRRRIGLDVEPTEDSFAMRRGRRLEPIARRLYERRTDNLVSAICCQHDQLDWMRASLDGITLAGDLVVEIKAPNYKAHAQALAGEVPEYYWPQVQHQLAVSGACGADYVSYSEHKLYAGTPQELAIVPVLPDADYIGRLIVAEKEFWRCCTQRIEPPERGWTIDSDGQDWGLSARARSLNGATA